MYYNVVNLLERNDLMKKLSIVFFTFALMLTATLSIANADGFYNSKGSHQKGTIVKNIQQLNDAIKNKKHHIIIDRTINGGDVPKTYTFADKSWDNLTIEGLKGSNPALVNIQLKVDGELLPANQSITNVVIKNIKFYGHINDLQKLNNDQITVGGVGVNYLGVSLRRVNNAIIKNNDFHDIPDDLFSISLSSDKVTVDHNHFWFSNKWLNMNPDPKWNWVGDWHDLASERLPLLIGANKNDSYMATGKLHVTLSNNWFGPNLKGRPLLRGYVHAYNNYFDNSTNPTGQNAQGYSQNQYNAMQIGSGSNILSEHNYFYKTNNSQNIGLDNKDDAYKFVTRHNTFRNTTGISAKSNAKSIKIPYKYHLIKSHNLIKNIKKTAVVR